MKIVLILMMLVSLSVSVGASEFDDLKALAIEEREDFSLVCRMPIVGNYPPIAYHFHFVKAEDYMFSHRVFVEHPEAAECSPTKGGSGKPDPNAWTSKIIYLKCLGDNSKLDVSIDRVTGSLIHNHASSFGGFCEIQPFSKNLPTKF